MGSGYIPILRNSWQVSMLHYGLEVLGAQHLHVWRHLSKEGVARHTPPCLRHELAFAICALRSVTKSRMKVCADDNIVFEVSLFTVYTFREVSSP